MVSSVHSGQVWQTDLQGSVLAISSAATSMFDVGVIDMWSVETRSHKVMNTHKVTTTKSVDEKCQC